MNQTVIIERAIATAVLVAVSFAGLAPAQTPPPYVAPTPGGQTAKEQKSFSQQELDQLVAPVALYPDNLLAQVLMAATYPLEVVQAQRWIKANPNLTGKALEDAVQKQPWDPAVKSVAMVPQIVTMMSEKLDWTQKLGDAFLAQPEDVMNTAQNLRQKASAQGTLQSTSQQIVSTEVVENKTIIKIEPSDPQVVYVPTYDPTVVYGTWWWPAYPPYYYYPPGYYAGGAFVAFTAGVIVGAAIWGNCNWGGGGVYVDHRTYNNFNRTNISSDRWQHNVEHRGQVPYRDQNVAQKYDRNRTPAGAQTREAYRGREGAAVSDNMARGGEVNRGGGSGETRDFGGGGAPRDFGASAATRDVQRSGFDGGSSTFGGGSGASTRAASNRGASSMGAARGGGGARLGGGGGRR